MSDQKNIDNLFRETFKDFEASPDPALWDQISDRLDAKESKKKREGIVFLPWLYKGAGIAAALLLLFFVGNEFLNTNDNKIGLDEQTTSTTKKDANSTKNNNGTTTDSQVTGTNAEKGSSNDANSSSNKIVNDKERIANENGVDNNNIQQKKGSETTVQKGNALQNAVVQQNGTNTNTNTASQKTSNSATNVVTNNKLSDKENAIAQNSSNKTNTSKNSIENGVNLSTTNTNAVAQNSNNKTNTSKNSIENGVNSATTNTNAVAQNSNNKTNTSKNSIENGVNSSTTNTNAVVQNDPNKSSNTADTTTNSETTETAVAEVKKDDVIKKSLLDVINDLHDLEKDTEVAAAKRKKWTISPNASPIYYNSINNGSPIDETFADNSKTGNVNLSYGVNVGYDVSKRLTVRSGIHKVDYSYSTQDIALVPSINGNDLTTIAFRTDAASFDIKDRQAPSNIVYSQYQLPSSESSIQEKQIEGNLNQRMSYIEVPVELKYAVLDKKLGINVIGGVSTLLLTENSIILDSPELYTELGEATNINDVSFSTNIGIGIDYKVSEQIELNVEPMLKYQLNTFSGNTGNFKPYSVGIYTGVSFRF
jgi:hypothetical protein